MMERMCVVDASGNTHLGVMDGWVRVNDVRVLLDSGESRMYVSGRGLERLRLKVKPNM